MECYLLTEPKIRGYRKYMLSLWLQKGMFWVSEKRLVDQTNIIRRNSCMTELEVEELERKVPGSDSVTVEEERSVEGLPKVDKVLSKFKIHSITKTNELFYAGAVFVTNKLGVKIDKVAWRKKPVWMRRLQNKMKEHRKD